MNDDIRPGANTPIRPGARHGMRSRRRSGLKALLVSMLLLIAVMLFDLAFPLSLPRARDAGAVVVARDGTPLRAFADRGRSRAGRAGSSR